MSWLHCMWGVGASLGPYMMGYALSGGQSWSMGYRYVTVLQIGLTILLLFSLPLWKGRTREEGETAGQALSTEVAAGFASLFFIGITIGRGICCFP